CSDTGRSSGKDMADKSIDEAWDMMPEFYGSLCSFVHSGSWRPKLRCPNDRHRVWLMFSSLQDFLPGKKSSLCIRWQLVGREVAENRPSILCQLINEDNCSRRG